MAAGAGCWVGGVRVGRRQHRNRKRLVNGTNIQVLDELRSEDLMENMVTIADSTVLHN